MTHRSRPIVAPLPIPVKKPCCEHGDWWTLRKSDGLIVCTTSVRLGGRFWDGGAAVGVVEFVDGGSGAGCSDAVDAGCEEELRGTRGVASHDLVGSGEEWSCVGVGWDILLEMMSAGAFRLCLFPVPAHWVWRVVLPNWRPSR